MSAGFDCYRGARVFVTGHTGFKGSWLCEWLLALGAEVHGFALEPPTDPALFDRLGLAGRIASHEIGDIRDRAALSRALLAAEPDFVFHLAAQPLVRLSYREPVETFAANVMGTVHLLDACRRLEKPCSVVCVTTDKVYANVLHKERQGEYLGRTVQIIPHITDEIKHFIYSVGEKGNADVVITEIGGTTGDIESQPFLEAIRQLGHEVGRENMLVQNCKLQSQGK